MHGESEVKSTVGLVTRFRAIRIFFFLARSVWFFLPSVKVSRCLHPDIQYAVSPEIRDDYACLRVSYPGSDARDGTA